MSKEILHTIGEVFDNLNYGQYAISNSGEDKGAIISIDEDYWAFIIYPGKDYRKYGINLKWGDANKNKRWLIKDLDNETIELFNNCPEF